MNENRTLILNPDGSVVEQGSPFLVFRLSWVAYLREILAFVVRLLLCAIVTTLIALGLERFAHIPAMTWLPGLGLVAALAWTAYSVALTNSVRLFTDENGVWMQSGVFPWEKGISGVQWRDLGQAGHAGLHQLGLAQLQRQNIPTLHDRRRAVPAQRAPRQPRCRAHQ